jgi:hypothetical protein
MNFRCHLCTYVPTHRTAIPRKKGFHSLTRAHCICVTVTDLPLIKNGMCGLPECGTKKSAMTAIPKRQRLLRGRNLPQVTRGRQVQRTVVCGKAGTPHSTVCRADPAAASMGWFPLQPHWPDYGCRFAASSMPLAAVKVSILCDVAAALDSNQGRFYSCLLRPNYAGASDPVI